MSMQRDPILTGLITAILLGIFTTIGVKMKREYRKIALIIKRVWKMGRGNGITLEEHREELLAFKTSIESFIKDATYPIQKDSNGGNALPDVVRSLSRIEKRLNEVNDTGRETLGMLTQHIQTPNAHKEK